MEQYNLPPASGIEVIISGSQPRQTETVNATAPTRQTQGTDFIKSTPTVRKRKPLHYLITRGLMLVSAFALIGNIPVHSKIASLPEDEHFALDTLLEQKSVESLEFTDTDDYGVQSVALNLPANSITKYVGNEIATLPAANTGQWKLHQIERGETLEDILKPLEVVTTVDELLANPAIKDELNHLQSNKKILVQINNRRIEQLIYATGKRKAYIVSWQDGSYTGEWSKGLYTEEHNQIAFTIHNPFHHDANKAGIPPSVARQLVRIFKRDINFRRISIGDQVSVIFEDYAYQSERIFTGKVLAAEFNHRGTIHQRVHFIADNSQSFYLKPDDDLEIKEVAFNRYPLKGGGRLSSGFGMRYHPVLGKRRLHSGTDFAAPGGTPIYATGDGRVSFVGRKGGYGKLIELRHADGIVTRYGHMSKYKRNLSVGSAVKRGDIIGYVGSTGRSTGNHVHYEFLNNGRLQNPMKVKLPSKGVLTAKEMREFKRLAKNMGYQLIKLRATAAIDRDMRQQFGG